MNNQTNQMNGKQACASWDDRCMVNDMLDTAKHIATEYGSYIIEGSSEPLRQVLGKNLNETL